MILCKFMAQNHSDSESLKGGCCCETHGKLKSRAARNPCLPDRKDFRALNML